jgi:uncharacterized membrane protein
MASSAETTYDSVVAVTEMTVVPLSSRLWAEESDCRVSIPRLVIMLFLAAQAWDGVFTYVAVNAYGIAAEGNAIIATWMHLIGPAPALLGAKFLAALCGVLLYLRGVHQALAALTLLYAVSALGPWLVIYAT